jgi:hypothetical protein
LLSAEQQPALTFLLAFLWQIKESLRFSKVQQQLALMQSLTHDFAAARAYPCDFGHACAVRL